MITEDWLDEPEEDADDLGSSWGIPLNEPVPPPRLAEPPADTDEPPPTFLLRPTEDVESEFHPRLRRFGEAS